MDESLKRQKWKNNKLTIKKRDAVRKRRYPFRKTSEKYYNSLNFYNGEYITLPLVISLVGGSSGISTESAANTYLSGYNKNISTVIKNNLDIFTSRRKQRRLLWFSREMTSRNKHSAEMPYWWRVTTQIWVVLLITSERAPMSSYGHPLNTDTLLWTVCSVPRGQGVLPYINHTGMFRPRGYGFCAVLVWKRVQTLPVLVWKRGDSAHFGLESGMVFKGTTGVYESIYYFNSRWLRKKEK